MCEGRFYLVHSAWHLLSKEDSNTDMSDKTGIWLLFTGAEVKVWTLCKMEDELEERLENTFKCVNTSGLCKPLSVAQFKEKSQDKTSFWHPPYPCLPLCSPPVGRNSGKQSRPMCWGEQACPLLASMLSHLSQSSGKNLQCNLPNFIFCFQGPSVHSLLPSPSITPILQFSRQMWCQERNTEVPGSCLAPSSFFQK